MFVAFFLLFFMLYMCAGHIGAHISIICLIVLLSWVWSEMKPLPYHPLESTDAHTLAYWYYCIDSIENPLFERALWWLLPRSICANRFQYRARLKYAEFEYGCFAYDHITEDYRTSIEWILSYVLPGSFWARRFIHWLFHDVPGGGDCPIDGIYTVATKTYSSFYLHLPMYVLTNLYPQDTVVNALAASEADDVWTGPGGSSDGTLAWGSDSDNPPIAADKTDVLRNNDNTSFGRGGAPKPSDVTSAPCSSLVTIGLYTPNRRVRTSKSYNTSNARSRQPAFARRRPCDDALNQCSEPASPPPPRVGILKSHATTGMDVKDTARTPRKTVRFDIPPADDKHDTASIDTQVLAPRPGQLQAEHTDDELKGGLSPRTANPSSSGNIASIEPKRPHFIYMDCPAIKVLLSDCLSANSILAGKSGRILYHNKPTCVAIVSHEDSAHVEKRRGICLGRGLAGIARYYQPVRHKPEFPSLQRSKGRYRSLAALRTHRLEIHLAKRYKKPTRSARRKRLDRLFANRSNCEHPASQSTGGEQPDVSSNSLVGNKRRKSLVTGVTNKKHHGGLVGSSPGGEQLSAPSSSAVSDKRPTGQGPSGVDQKRPDGNSAGGKQPVVPNAGVMNDKRPAGQGASSTNSALANTQQVGWPTMQPSPGLSFGAGGTGTSASFTSTAPVFTLGKVTGQRGTRRLTNIHVRRPTRVNGNRSFSLFGTARNANGEQGSLLERHDMEIDSNGSNPVASLRPTNVFGLGNFPNTYGKQDSLFERHDMEVDPNGYNPAASLESTNGFGLGNFSNADGEQGNILKQSDMEVDPNSYNPAASLGSIGGLGLGNFPNTDGGQGNLLERRDMEIDSNGYNPVATLGSTGGFGLGNFPNAANGSNPAPHSDWATSTSGNIYRTDSSYPESHSKPIPGLTTISGPRTNTDFYSGDSFGPTANLESTGGFNLGNNTNWATSTNARETRGWTSEFDHAGSRNPIPGLTTIPGSNSTASFGSTGGFNLGNNTTSGNNANWATSPNARETRGWTSEFDHAGSRNPIPGLTTISGSGSNTDFYSGDSFGPTANLESTGGFDSGTGSNSIPISNARPIRRWTSESDHANSSNPIPGLTTIPGSNSTANLGSTGGFDHAESSRSATDFNPYYGF